MSAKQRRAAVAPVGSAQPDAEAEIGEYYDRLRQRAAEKPLQIRVLSRAGGELSADEKERWLQFGQLKRDRLVSTIDGLISELESEPHIDSLRKLSIARSIWSIMQIQFDDASCAIKLERIATTEDNKKNSAKTARDGKATLNKYLITKCRADEQRKRDPDLSNTKIAKEIRQNLNAELAKSGVPIFHKDETLAKFIGRIFENDASNGRRKFQRQRKSLGQANASR
jgi:hypothetical protein